MNTIWSKPTISESVAKFISIFFEPGEIEFRSTSRSEAVISVYSYEEDFDQIWGVDGKSKGFFSLDIKSLPRKDIILIIDEAAETSWDHKSMIKRFLGPVEFILTFASWMKEAKSTHPSIRLFVVCPTKRKISAELNELGREYGLDAEKILSWIKIIDSNGRADLSDILVSLMDSILKPREHSPALVESLPEKVIKVQYLEKIDSLERHLFNNVLGLMFFLDNDVVSAEAKALKRFISLNQILPELSVDAGYPWIKWTESPFDGLLKRYLRLDCHEIRIHLIDDMLGDEGWDKVITKWLGLNQDMEKEIYGIKIKIFPHQDTTQLVDRLARKQRFELFNEFAPPSENKTHADLVLLDLRLFAKNDPREIDCFRKLYPLAKQLSDDRFRENIPIKQNLEIIENWLKEKYPARENDAYYHALTILPMLIHMIDPALPVILFSSTGRRKIVDILKNYENIITNFEKPRIMESGSKYSEIIKETKYQFCEALYKAGRIALPQLYYRKVDAFLEQVSNRSSYEYLKNYYCSFSTDKKNDWHVEIFIDESGDAAAQIVLGGIVAIFPPGTDYSEYNLNISTKYEKEYETIEVSPRPSWKDYMRSKRRDIANDIREIYPIERGQLFLSAISITGSLAEAVFCDTVQYGSTQDEIVGDNLYREMFRCLIETAIYGYVQEIIPAGERITFSVRGATRAIPEPEYGFADSMKRKWGNNSSFKKGKNYVKFVGKDSIRPMVDEIMREYRNSQYAPFPEIIRAYPLNSSKYEGDEHSQFLHYCADVILTNTRGRQDNFKYLWDKGFKIKYDHERQTRLTSQRLIMNGRNAEGALESNKIIVALPMEAAGYATILYCRLLKRAFENMNSGEIEAFVNGLFKKKAIYENEIVGKAVRAAGDGFIITDGREEEYFAGPGALIERINLNDEVIFMGRRNRSPDRRKIAINVRRRNDG